MCIRDSPTAPSSTSAKSPRQPHAALRLRDGGLSGQRRCVAPWVRRGWQRSGGRRRLVQQFC
eukprot:3072540-Alexandrium_andersonii.AAC.1